MTQLWVFASLLGFFAGVLQNSPEGSPEIAENRPIWRQVPVVISGPRTGPSFWPSGPSFWPSGSRLLGNFVVRSQFWCRKAGHISGPESGAKNARISTPEFDFQHTQIHVYGLVQKLRDYERSSPSRTTFQTLCETEEFPNSKGQTAFLTLDRGFTNLVFITKVSEIML